MVLTAHNSEPRIANGHLFITVSTSRVITTPPGRRNQAATQQFATETWHVRTVAVIAGAFRAVPHRLSTFTSDVLEARGFDARISRRATNAPR